MMRLREHLASGFNAAQRLVHWLLREGLHIERRFEPWFRPWVNRLFREPVAGLVQWGINFHRRDDALELADERVSAEETQCLDDIIDLMSDQMRGNFKPGRYERGGNTKTHGLVKATVTVHDNLPAHLRQGVFSEPISYPAYVRFSGPGPDVPADMRDVGFGSMAVKLMDVPGDKLMEEEKFTQDFIAVTTPTFVTPTVCENAKLQNWSLRKLPIFYFLNVKDPHIADFLMQGLWNETLYNPLGQRYWSCVPYLLGEGQAMMYSFIPKTPVHRNIEGLPFGAVSFNYLRDNMATTLNEHAVEFDLAVQIQTDPYRMPIEHAGVRWPEKLSPFIPLATISIPSQIFDTPERWALVDQLRLNPWHALAAHRPLGNQNRARRRMYQELSRFRLEMNDKEHVEPVGDEVD